MAPFDDGATRVEMVNRARVLVALAETMRKFENAAGELPRFVAVGILAGLRRWSSRHPEHAWDELVRDADETLAIATEISKGQTN